jgi:hypothetical protein
MVVFDFVIGFFVGLMILVICFLLGAPASVAGIAALLAGTGVWLASWLRTSVRFTPSRLVITALLWPRRIPWPDVQSVSLQDMFDNETDEVTQQRLVIHYRRGSGLRLVTLPLFFPVPEMLSSDKPRSWIRRRADRQREVIREQLAARGYPLAG